MIAVTFQAVLRFLKLRFHPRQFQSQPLDFNFALAIVGGPALWRGLFGAKATKKEYSSMLSSPASSSNPPIFFAASTRYCSEKWSIE